MAAVLLVLAVVLRQKAPEVSITEAPAISDTDHVYGSRDAKVVLVEYSDFQCPACRMYAPVIAQIEEEFPESVAVVYRHFPLRTIHKHAELAARAAEAAGMQGKFFEFHDALFVGQETWAQELDPTKAFEQMASELGLNAETFRSDMKSKGVKEAVQADVAEGEALGIQSTPSFFLNGAFVKDPSGMQLVETVRKAVEEVEI